MKRARYGPENRTDVCDDFTRLTLVSITSATGGTIEPLLQTKTGPVAIGGGKSMVILDANFRYELSRFHTDPAVYGLGVEVYGPERMLDKESNKLPKNIWKVLSKLPDFDY